MPAGEPRRYLSHPQGYVRLRWKVAPYTYVEVYEHRVRDGAVVEAEHVHHENRDRQDNRPENLHPLSAAEHYAAHRPADFEEIAALYRQGWSTPRLGRHFARDHSAIYRMLARHGVIQPGRRYDRAGNVL